jgi:hypothetical protein
MKKARLMMICCLTLMVMLFLATQALAYTFTVKNQTSKPIKASFYYLIDKSKNDHEFNSGNDIAPGQSSTSKHDGVRCMSRLNIKYNGEWHYKNNPGCGNKTFTIKEGINISD